MSRCARKAGAEGGQRAKIIVRGAIIPAEDVGWGNGRLRAAATRREPLPESVRRRPVPNAPPDQAFRIQGPWMQALAVHVGQVIALSVGRVPGSADVPLLPERAAV